MMRAKLMEIVMDDVENTLKSSVRQLGQGSLKCHLVATHGNMQPRIDRIIDEAWDNAKLWTETVDKHLDRHEKVEPVGLGINTTRAPVGLSISMARLSALTKTMFNSVEEEEYVEVER